MLVPRFGIHASLVSIFCLVLLGSAVAQSPTKLPTGVKVLGTVEGITEYKLENGLRILLLPDASQPKVTVNCTIFVGSRHEGYGETGMAHLLEHMVFKGCPKFPDVPKALRDHGAVFNGTTWVDRTNYFETMPANDDNLEFGIELEADRLVNSFIAREELLKEFSVVRNEFERGENSPERVLSQRMMAVAFEWHNYGKSTIGNRTDIERVPVENLQAFYKKFYRPENALLIIAGKFDSTKALEFTAKYFGPLKNPKEPLPKTYTEEPAQDGERLVTLRRVGTDGATGVVYHIPSGVHPAFAAVQVLEQTLTSEPSGRVYKALVEAKLASSISGSAFAWHDPGVIEITAQTEADKTEKARDVLVKTLESLHEQPLTADEVERARRQILRYQERILANSQTFAIQLSEWAACGDWRLFFLHRDRIEKVTVDEVNQAARTYLIRANRTVGIYIPTQMAERAQIPETPNPSELVKNYKGRTALASGEAFDPTPENVEKRVQRGTIAEGIKYALLPKKTRGETVNLNLNIRVGNEESFKGKLEAFDFLGQMLLRGTKSKTRQQIQDELEKLNASLSISTDSDRALGLISISIQTKNANLLAVLKLLGEVLREPSFPASEFELLKRESMDSLEKGRTEPQVLAVVALRRKMMSYPKDDVRYIPTIEEAIQRLKNTTVEQVAQLYRSHMSSQVGELSIVGDFDPEPAIAQLTLNFKGMKNDIPFRRIPRLPSKVDGQKITINTPDKANAIYMAGQMLPMNDRDERYPAAVVGNYLLGGAPLASRLSNRVRGKEGLSYGVGSMISAHPIDPSGQFMIFAIANPQNIAKVDKAIEEEVSKFLKEGVSADELEQAKRAYLQTQKVQRGNDGTLASQLTGALFAGRTFDYYAELEKKIDSLQPGDLKRAYNSLVNPKNLVIVEAGDFKK